MTVKHRKKMKEARKMREQQLNVLKGIGFLIVLAIGLAIFQPAKAATVTISVPARPVIVSRPATVSPTVRVSTPSTPRVSAPAMRSSSSYRSMNETSTTNSIPMPLYVPIFLNGSGASASEKVEVATPFLTKCTNAQFEQAKLWQEDCKNIADINAHYCPILSYFRYCKEADPSEVQDLKTAGDKYKHVFLTGD
jgi:hypothetical protein